MNHEYRSILSLSAILCLRMCGLFAALPLLALYASQLKQSTPALVGMVLGVYGLTQALFQIPLGTWSDRIGRKPVITLGLLIFILGSALSALASSIFMLIAGRALQGAGAIGSTTLAFLADLTPESHRTKAMAIIGMLIGLSFSLALILGPLLLPHTGMNGIFWLAAGMGGVALVILYTSVPTAPLMARPEEKNSIWEMFFFKKLTPLYLSIFILHVLFTATFVVLPTHLQNHIHFTATHQWLLYAPTLFIGFIFSLIIIVRIEKNRAASFFYFITAFLFLGIGESLLMLFAQNLLACGIGLLLFFTGFSTLEAIIPSKVSRTAPPDRRGTAMGIHSTAQFLGIFFGGVSAGWIEGQYGWSSVYALCILLAFCWAILLYINEKSTAESTFQT